MSHWGPTKRNTQLVKWLFFEINQTNILFKKENANVVTVSFTTFLYFLRRRHHTAEANQRWAPKVPSTIFLATISTQKMLESSDSMYSSIFMQAVLREADWIHKNWWSLFKLWVPGDSKQEQNSLFLVNSAISCKIVIYVF